MKFSLAIRLGASWRASINHLKAWRLLTTVQSTDGSSGWSVGYGIQCQSCPPNGELIGTHFVIPTEP